MAGVLGFAGTWRPRGVAANGAACGAARVRDATVFGIWRTAFGARHRRPTVRLLATTTISSEERYLPLCSAHPPLVASGRRSGGSCRCVLSNASGVCSRMPPGCGCSGGWQGWYLSRKTVSRVFPG